MWLSINILEKKKNKTKQKKKEYGLLPADARQQLKICQKAASLKKVSIMIKKNNEEYQS